MIIIFSKAKLKENLEDPKRRNKRWGAEMSNTIQRRLDQMRAADHLAILRFAPGKYHELKGDRAGQLATHLVEPYRLIFVPDGDSAAFLINGSLVWEKVVQVIILEIIDYHD